MVANIKIIGAAVGNIIATIITIQMATKTGALNPIVRLIMASSAARACQPRMIQLRAARASSAPRTRLRSRRSGYDAVAMLPPNPGLNVSSPRAKRPTCVGVLRQDERVMRVDAAAKNTGRVQPTLRFTGDWAGATIPEQPRRALLVQAAAGAANRTARSMRQVVDEPLHALGSGCQLRNALREAAADGAVAWRSIWRPWEHGP